MIIASCWRLLSGLAFLGTAMASNASAAVVTYTYSGNVQYGYDHAGIFGSDTDLTGRSFELVETFDSSKAAYRYASDGLQSFQYGGALNGAPDAASLVVTIGSTSRSILDLNDYIYSGAQTGKHLDFVKNDNGYEYAGFYVASTAMLADYTQPMTLNSANAFFTGNYQYFDANDSQRATYANFDVDTLNVTTSLVSVPLPPSLSMFAASLLGLGILARLKRRQSGVARD